MLILVLTLCFGFWGISRLPSRGPSGGWLDTAYHVLQLFVLDSDPANTGPLPWQLQVARFLAPVGAAYALVEVGRQVFDDGIDRLRVRRMREHAVVVGASGTADVIAGALETLGRKVVRTDQGWPLDLRNSGVPGAAVVYACLDDSEDPLINIAVCAEVDRMRSGRRAEPCLVSAHVSDPDLALAIQARHLSRLDPGLDVFTLHEIIAQRLAREDSDIVTGEHPRISIVGAGVLAQSLALALARARELVPAANPMTLTFAGTGAEEAVARTKQRLGEEQETCQVLVEDSAAPPRRTYICHDDDSESLRFALTETSLWHGGADSLVLVLTRLEQVRQMFSDETGAPLLENLAGRLRIVAASRLVAAGREGLERIHDDVYERMSATVHHIYLQNQLSRGLGWQATPAMVAWENLDERLRQQNHDQVRAIPAKLAAIGCTIAPRSSRRPVAVLSGDEIEILAREEHTRWSEQQRRGGTAHASLVPWAELSAAEKEKDRDAVRGTAVVLEHLGLQLVRF